MRSIRRIKRIPECAIRKQRVGDFIKNRFLFFNIIFLITAYATTIGCIITGTFVQQGYLVQVGQPSVVRLKAPIRVEDKISSERNRQAAKEAADRLDPITTRDLNVVDELFADLDAFFITADEFRRSRVEIFTPYTEEIPTENFSEDEHNNDGLLEPSQLPTPTPAPPAQPAPKLEGLTESASMILLELENDRYNDFIDAVFNVAGTVMDRGVAEINENSLVSVKNEMDKHHFNADVRSLGYDIIAQHLMPNIIVDEEATARAREERESRYERIFYQQGETIVDDGQIVTPEMYAVLDELGLINTGQLENIIQLLGAAVVLLALFAVTAFYMFYFPQREYGLRETALMFALYIIMVLSARALIEMPIQLLPLTIFVILIAAFLGARTAIVLNIGVTIACFMIVGADIEFLLFYLVSGTAVALFAGKTTDRSRIFISALLTSAVNMGLFAGAALFSRNFYSAELLFDSAFVAMAGMLSVIISFGSMPVWEAAFGLVTPIRLLDLTNPDSKLLRQLAIEAPGTYHHSVIVANLAETAAYDVGANMSVSRAGGYYHDIGKLKYPQYFVENVIGTNPHDDMDAYSSVQVIMSHVSYGRELAESNKLPKVIRDIIAQHHGTTLLKYFYHKARSESLFENLDEHEYRYPYEIPQSKEAAIVMLADTVEAAVRSMIPTGKTMDEVAAFATQLVRDKLDDGQLLDSTLTIRDLDTVVKSFMRVFRGMYHERIPYPTDDKNKDKNKDKEKVAEEKEVKNDD